MSPSESLKRIWRWVKWPLAVLVVLYVIDVAWATSKLFDKDKTDAVVAAIHAQHITLADVQGKSLPPPPDQVENDSTVEGIDSNNNGIRDDVELAIFKKYPNSEKVRAAELQYAMAIQTMLARVYNTETWIAAAQESSRAYSCISQTYSRINLQEYIKVTDDRTKEVQDWVLNTSSRKTTQSEADNYTTSYSLPNTDLCNIDLLKLPN